MSVWKIEKNSVITLEQSPPGCAQRWQPVSSCATMAEKQEATESRSFNIFLFFVVVAPAGCHVRRALDCTCSPLAFREEV